MLVAALTLALAAPLQARAETVVERAARTGVITMGGRTDLIPYVFQNERKELVGYAIDVARLIEAELSTYLNRPVRVVFEPVTDADSLFRQVSRGDLDLACGAQFTWEREMFVDFSVPFSLSGIRVLTRSGGPEGSADGLKGRRIAAVPGSLGESAIRQLRPGAEVRAVSSLEDGFERLRSGRVDGVAGDSILLAGEAQRAGGQGFELVPPEPLARYAVGCILPENNSTFRNLVNLAIARLIQGYVVGDPDATSTVNRWLGPEGILQLPPELIRSYFQTVLLSHEPIRLPATTPAPPSR